LRLRHPQAKTIGVVTIEKIPDWGSEDAENLRGFLRTPTGGKFLRAMDMKRRAYPRNVSFSRASIALGRTMGFDEVEALIELLAVPPETPKEESATTQSLPALEDDSAWVQDEVTGRVTLASNP
jgi:hypothetical protein